MPYNPFFKLKEEPIFNIEKDIEEIRRTPLCAKNKPVMEEKRSTPLPYGRAYIYIGDFEPVAIFGPLPPASLGVFVKLILCLTPDGIPELNDYSQGQAMNAYKLGLRKRWIKRPFKLAYFVADRLWYHVSIPVDLMIDLCVRFSEYDIVDRDFWSYVTYTAEWDKSHVDSDA